MSIIAREEQEVVLNRVLGKGLSRVELPSGIFIWGPESSGKTFLCNKIFQDIKAVFAKVSAHEVICGIRPFLETILKKLFQGFENTPNVKCENLRIFVRILKDFYREFPQERENRFIILVTNAEFLRSEAYENILNVFFSIRELLQANICVILESRLPFSLYLNINYFKQVCQLHFPQYTKEEIIKIIKADCKHDKQNRGAYNENAKKCVQHFYSSCRDLRKLSKYVKDSFRINDTIPKSPSKRKSTTAAEQLINWRLDKKLLKASFQNFSSNFVPFEQLDEFNGSKKPKSSYFDLTRTSKYLLIAGFLASRNPPKFDERFFVKIGGKKKRSKKIDMGEEYLPSSFSHDRFLAIFRSIIRDSDIPETEIDSTILTNVASLCQMGLLNLAGKFLLDERKYRCNVDYDLIIAIGRSVNFDVPNYIYKA